MKGFFFLLSALIYAVSLVNATNVLWKLDDDSARPPAKSALRNQRLANMNLGATSFFRMPSVSAANLRHNSEYYFEVPSKSTQIEAKSCVLKERNPIVPKALAEAVPAVKHFSCVTENGEVLTITSNTLKDDGFSAHFQHSNGNSVYIDSAVKDSDLYMIYPVKQSLNEGTPINVADKVISLDSDAEMQTNLRQNFKRRASTDAYIFRAAIVTSKQWSAFHGDTVESVLAAVVTTYSRVNAVYNHEFGVFLELIPNAHLSFCLSTSTDSACLNYGNDEAVIDQNLGVLTSRGIPSSSYDIGHGVTTNGGGLAALSSLCTGNKASGMTGNPQPNNDGFYIDYISHELGHQFRGFHSFRDCGGSNDASAGVEPGSGSTIMGYAGICGNDNLQAHSDPYFNSLNLEHMYDLVLSRVNQGCGEVIALNNVLPQISAPNSCTVPVNTPFQLRGSTSSSESTNSFFSWDRIDTGFEDFSSTTEGKFRPWKPTPAKSRFFPNLNYVAFGSNQREERLPTIAKDMTFRFTERRLYVTNLFVEDFDLAQMGDFVSTDTNVNFVSGGAFKITSPSASTLQSGQSVTVTWSLSIGSTVGVYVAIDKLVQVSNFDYEEHNVELDWVLAGTASMSAGSVTVTLPSLSSSQESVAIMLRGSTTSDLENCFFFDLARGFALLPGEVQAPTSPPVPAPTSPPVPAPTSPPVPAPTSPPVASPTSPPVTSPTLPPVVAPTPGTTTTTVPSPTEAPSSAPGIDLQFILVVSVGVVLVLIVVVLLVTLVRQTKKPTVSKKSLRVAPQKKVDGPVVAAKGLYEGSL